MGLVTALSCRGGGGEERLTREEFVDEAGAICRASGRQVGGVEPPSLADPAAVERAIGEAVAIQRRALRELRRLDPPAADEVGVEQWLDDVAATLDQMEAVAAAVRDGDRAALEKANARGAELDDVAEEFAVAYGLEACSTTTAEEQPGR
jgi:hypothetical protein